MTPGSVIDLLKLRDYLSDAQAEELEDQLKTSSKDIVQLIVDYGLMTRDQVFGLIAEDLEELQANGLQNQLQHQMLL